MGRRTVGLMTDTGSVAGLSWQKSALRWNKVRAVEMRWTMQFPKKLVNSGVPRFFQPAPSRFSDATFRRDVKSHEAGWNPQITRLDPGPYLGGLKGGLWLSWCDLTWRTFLSAMLYRPIAHEAKPNRHASGFVTGTWEPKPETDFPATALHNECSFLL